MRARGALPRAIPVVVFTLLTAPTCERAQTEAPDPNAAADAPPRSGSPVPAAVPASASPIASSPSPAPPRPPHTIYRSELVRVTQAGPAYVLRALGPEPFRYNGRFVGWEITQVFPDDPQICAAGCDLHPGDIVLSVNGSRLETPQELSDEFDKLLARADLSIVWLRDEKRHTVRYAIVDDPPATP